MRNYACRVTRSTLRIIVVLMATALALPLAFLTLGHTVRDALHPPTPAAPDAAGLSLACVGGVPTNVDDLNTWIDTARNVGGFVGADVGASVELSDGRSLWVFGDSLRSASAPGPAMVHNSMLLVDDACIRLVGTPDLGAVVPDAADGSGYWPVSIDHLAVPGGDRVAVGLFKVRFHGTGMWDFEVAGSAVAVFEVPTGGTPELLEVRDVADHVTDDRPAWGVSVAVVDDWVHLYGTARPTPTSTGWSLHVARTRVDDLTEPDEWQYWNGRNWHGGPADAAAVIPAEHGVSRVLSVFRRDGAWYAVSKRDDFIGTDLVIWKGSSPHGPFEAFPPVLQIPSTSDRLRYMALAHPHLLPEPGSVVVSWSRNGGDLAAIRSDPTRYRPVFARVPLP